MKAPGKTPPLIFGLVALCCLLIGCSERTNDRLADFQQVQAGWKVSEVIDLLGEPDSYSKTMGLYAVWIYRTHNSLGHRYTLTLRIVRKWVVMTTIDKE